MCLNVFKHQKLLLKLAHIFFFIWRSSVYEDMECSDSQNDAGLINDLEQGLGWHLKVRGELTNKISLLQEKRPFPQCNATQVHSLKFSCLANWSCEGKKCRLIHVWSSLWTACVFVFCAPILFHSLPFPLFSTRCFDLRFLISADAFLGLRQPSLLEMNRPASLSDNNHNLELDLD